MWVVVDAVDRCAVLFSLLLQLSEIINYHSLFILSAFMHFSCLYELTLKTAGSLAKVRMYWYQQIEIQLISLPVFFCTVKYWLFVAGCKKWISLYFRGEFLGNCWFFGQILDRKNAEIDEVKRQCRQKSEEQDKLLDQAEKKGLFSHFIVYSTFLF